MADNLIFPIGFDLEAAVKKASKDWDGKYADQLEKAIQKRALAVKLKVDTKNLDSLDAVKQRLAQLKIQPITPETRTAIRELAKELQTLAKALEQVQKFSKTNQLGQQNFRNDVALERLRQANERLEIQKRRVALAEQKHAEAMNRSTTASRNLSQSFAKQDGYISRLLKRMAVYAAYSGVTTFLTSVREVTAEFELQRVSLGAIIQSQKKANLLFSEIKSFALTSPVSILDLTKYTKQLAAYKIGYDELFETTKRLTDVSVGLGVSMDRIVLLYGQVRATGYLRASEVRQATEAGIPIVEELAKKLTTMNGELVRASDVMDMISKREIGFDLVKEVFEDMTDKGGAFYNMQIKQGNTLYGMWQKLGDAASVMYDQIGNTESVNSAMKSVIQMLTDLMRNWKAWGNILMWAGGLYLANMGAMKLLTAATVRYTAAGKAKIAATNADVVAQQRLVLATRNAGTMTQWSARLSVMHANAQRQAAMATNIFSMAMYSLKAAFLSNPLGMVITAVTTLIALFYDADDSAKQFASRLSEINEKFLINQARDAQNFAKLADIAVGNADGSKEQEEALDELNRTYGEALGLENLRIEALRAMNGEYSQAIDLIDEYNTRLMYAEREGAIKEYYGQRKKDAFSALEGQLADIGFGSDELGHSEAQQILFDIQSSMLDALEEGKDISADMFEEEFVKQAKEVFKARGRSDAQSWARIVYSRASGEVEDWIEALKSERDALDKNNKKRDEAIANLNQYADAVNACEKVLKENQDAQKSPAMEDYNALIQQQVDAVKKTVAEISGVQIDATDAFGVTKAINEIIEKTEDPKLRSSLATLRTDLENAVPTDTMIVAWRNTFVKAFEDFAKKTPEINNSANKLHNYLIKNGESLDEYGKRIKGVCDGLQVQMDNLRKTLDTAVLSDEGRAQFTEDLETTTALFNFLTSFASTDAKKSSGGSKSDPRLGILQEMVASLKNANKEYDELKKKKGDTKALADTQAMYKRTFEYMQKMNKEYKFGLSLTMPTDTKSLTAQMEQIRKAMAKLPKSEKAVMALELDISKTNIDKAQKDIEKSLKDLSDRIAKTKTAKEFYEKILSQTGDVELAATLSFAVYGEDGEALKQQIIDNIAATLGTDTEGVQLDFTAVIRADKSVDYDELVRIAEGYQKTGAIAEETVNKIKKMRDEDRKDLAKTVEGWLKATEKAKTYSDKLLDLARTTNNEIAEISRQKGYAQTRADALLGKETLTADEQTELTNLQNFLMEADTLIQRFKDKQTEEEVKLGFEAFKDSPMYVQMFDDLDHASTRMLENMKARIEGMQGAWKNLDPTQLKELQSRLNEIDKLLAQRNPFKGLVDGIKEYRRLRTKGDSRGNKSEQDAGQDLIDTAKAADEARKKYEKILHEDGATKEDIAEAKRELDDAMANEEAAQKAVGNWKKVKDTIGRSANGLFQMLNGAGDIAGAIADISEVMGADEEDVQYWNDVSSALGNITGGIQDIVSAAMKGDVMGVVSSALTAVPKMFVGFAKLFSAGKIKRANKEIKRQQELLDQLAYTYERLEKAADNLFGGDYIQNYNQQIRNLQAQRMAYLKQAHAERSKGKDSDEKKVKEYEEKARDTADKIKEMQDELVEHFTGTDRASAAKDFAQAWLEAKASFANTTDAIKSKYKDLIRNMIIEGAAAKIFDSMLAPLWDQVAELLEKRPQDPTEAIDLVVSSMDEFASKTNNAMNVLYESLKQKGIDMKDIFGDDDSNLTGISRDIASASEESINGLAAGINTQNFYISHVPTISENVAAMRRIMEGGNMALSTSTVDTTALWTQHLELQQGIHRHTAETVEECKRIAEQCTAMAQDIHRVVVPRGSKGTHGVQVYM